MRLRRLLPTLLVLAATAAPAAAAVAEDNKVTAVNETDGAQVFQLSIDLRRITEGPVLDQNIAQAYSSCEDCRTIAIAVQVLLLMEDIRQVVPVNVAESINYECTSCESLAYAGQLVLSTGGKVRLTGEARRTLDRIERELNALQESDASLLEIYAEIDRLVDDLKITVVDGLVPIGGQGGAQASKELGSDRDADPATGTAADASVEADGAAAPDGDLPVVAGDDGTDAIPAGETGVDATAGPDALSSDRRRGDLAHDDHGRSGAVAGRDDDDVADHHRSGAERRDERCACAGRARRPRARRRPSPSRRPASLRRRRSRRRPTRHRPPRRRHLPRSPPCRS